VHPEALLVDLAREPMLVLDRGGAVLRVNAAARELFGAAAADRTWLELLDAGDAPAAAEALERATRTGAPVDVAARAMSAAGRAAWHEWRVAHEPERDQVLVAGRRLVERSPVAEVVGDALDGSPVGWAILSPDGRFVRVNHALAAMLGLQQAEILGREMWEIEDAPSAELVAAERRALALGSLDGFRSDRRYRHADGRTVRGRLVATLARDAAGAPEHYLCQVEDVTRRMEALDRMAANEAKLAEAQQIAKLGSWEWDVVADRVSWSDELYRIHGIRPGARPSLYGADVERIHPDDRGRVERVVEAAIAERRGWSVDYRIVRGDGEVRMVHARGEVVLGDDGEPVLVRGTCQDVTESRRVEDALRAAEQLFRRAFDDAPMGMALLDADRRWLRLNRALCQMLGRTEAEMRALRLDEIAQPADQEGERALMLQLLEGSRRAYAVEQRYTHADGSTIHALLHVSILRGEGARPLYFLCQLVDLTERRRAEAERRAGEQRLQAIVDNAPALIAVKDAQLRHVLVNRRWQDLFGIGATEALGRRPTEIGRLPNAAEAEALSLAVLDSTSPREILWPVTTPEDRQVQLLTLEFPVFDAEGRVNGVCSIATDVTERRRSADERAELERRLARSQRLETVGRLAGGVAHDFNNLLSVILTCAGFALRELDGDHAVREDVEEIRGAAERASRLVRQLLMFSRREVVQPETIDLARLLVDLEGLLRRSLSERVRLEVDCSADTPPVLVDPARIEQALLNLVLNARDAIGDTGGTVRVSSERTPGGRARIVVGDDGPGMPPEVAERAFEPFFTTKIGSEGTGLGLATVESVVADSGGQVEIESQPGLGTRVIIELPPADPTQETVETLAPQGAGAAANGAGSGRVLLVEDQAPVRRQARRILESYGYEVLDAEDGESAVDLLDEDIDLLLTDVVMPGMSGSDLAALATERRPTLRVVFMSGHTEDVILREGVREGDVGFVQKPFSQESLLRAVALALAPEAIG
jgi:PAS domain S-box-containing protein